MLGTTPTRGGVYRAQGPTLGPRKLGGPDSRGLHVIIGHERSSSVWPMLAESPLRPALPV
eukprot:9471430-Pyramimonas_sp.AAC.2